MTSLIWFVRSLCFVLTNLILLRCVLRINRCSICHTDQIDLETNNYSKAIERLETKSIKPNSLTIRRSDSHKRLPSQSRPLLWGAPLVVGMQCRLVENCAVATERVPRRKDLFLVVVLSENFLRGFDCLPRYSISHPCEIPNTESWWNITCPYLFRAGMSTMSKGVLQCLRCPKEFCKFRRLPLSLPSPYLILSLKELPQALSP